MAQTRRKFTANPAAGQDANPGAADRLPGDAAARSLAALVAGWAGGRLWTEEPLARHSTFRIGGPAQWMVEAPSAGAVGELVRWAAERGLPLHPHGLGSNILFPDDGVRGIVLRLAGGLRRARLRGGWVSAGAGLPLPQLARRTAERGLLGLEALSGFPSTVGGAVVMNAGSYGAEIKDVLVRATVVDRAGRLRRLGLADLAPSYRTTRLQGSGSIVVRALLRLRPGDAAAAVARIEELNARRWAALPSGQPNAGSIFRNPPGDHAGRLIEAAGLKGTRRGGAAISAKHANVIVNLGGARAEDVVALMAEARRAVRRTAGVTLEPEVILAGGLRRRFEDWSGSGADAAEPAPEPERALDPERAREPGPAAERRERERGERGEP